MESGFSDYSYFDSLSRIDEILKGEDAAYEDKNSIPLRSALTFDNGYYVKVCVLFVDLRDSKGLSDRHTRSVLAKIYRAYISETIAVLRGNENISEIYVEGDGLWAVFDTPLKSDVDSVFSTAARVSSLVSILNVKLRKRGYSEIRAGIGMDYGESLYIKAGHKGSGVNEVVWIGRVVGSAAHLCKSAAKLFNETIQVSEVIFENLSDHNKKLLSYNAVLKAYQGDVVNTAMNEWVQQNG